MAEGGYPYVNPLWYAYENGAFLVAGSSRAQWVGHIRSNSKVAACIDTPDAPYSRVLVQADADIIDDSWTGDWEHWALRYLGEDLAINTTRITNTCLGFSYDLILIRSLHGLVPGGTQDIRTKLAVLNISSEQLSLEGERNLQSSIRSCIS